MDNTNTGQPSAPTQSHSTNGNINDQQSHTSIAERVGEPLNVNPLSTGFGRLSGPAIPPASSSTFNPSQVAGEGGSAGVQKSSSTAIAPSSSSISLDNARLLTPATFPNASPFSAGGPVAPNTLNAGPNSASTSFQNQLRYGNAKPGGSSRGFDKMPLSNPAAQQHSSQAVTSSSRSASTSLPASTLAVPANGTIVNKPVLTMKRTGQNFPLNSGMGSLQQRNGSNSPNRRHGSLPSNVTRKAPDLAKTCEREQKEEAARYTEKLSAPFKVEPQQTLRFLGNAGPIDLPPNTSRGSTNAASDDSTTVAVQDSASDDIIYETTVQTGDVSAAMDLDNDSTSDDSNSQSDDDEIKDMDEAEASLRQLFRAPDQDDGHEDDGDEDDGDEGDGVEDDGDEEDGDEDDSEEDDGDVTSESSSGDSSVADEPAVALPSANIQTQEAYPSKILEMAEPGRLYTEYRDKGVIVKASPALFPVGYEKCTTPSGFPWVCAVRSCRLRYKTAPGLSNHARFTHKKSMFNDNMDGTVSLVGYYSRKNQAGHFPPVVVSRLHLNPKEPPMREPVIPGRQQFSSKFPPDHEKMEMSAAGGRDADSLEVEEAPSPTPTADSRSSEQMWEYIRPFLSNHHAIPRNNWVRHVIHLPRVRNIEWNEERMKEHPFKDTHPRDITALIIQVTGVDSPNLCGHCAQGRGPFKGCIIVSPEAPSVVKDSVISCANCYYHCNQSFCSLCKNEVARRARRAGARQKPNSYNVKLLSDMAQQRSARTMLTNQQQSLLDSTTPLETPARPNLKLYLPSEFKIIEKASRERSYKVIKGEDGKDVLMCGALIPDNYDLDHTIPSYPWICPIRSCRKVFKKIVSLGSHFVKAHPTALLNDNQDGTFSQIGYYNTPQPGHNAFPALIISQNPLDPNEPPMETAALPGTANQVPNASKPQPIKKKTLGTTQFQPGKFPTATELWNYVLPYLPKSPTSIYSDLRVLSLFKLPRQRELQWRMNLQNVELLDDRSQILGLIVYLTGNHHRQGTRSCTHCARHNGPFPGCLTLTLGIPEDSQALVRSCANCVFTHMSSSCSIKSGKSRDADEPLQPEAPAKKRAWITDDESEEPAAMRRRSDRLGLVSGHDDTEPRKRIVTLSTKHQGLAKTANNGGLMENQASSALIRTGQFQSESILEMEDWEISPGRIRNSDADGLDKTDIAFSKSYLESNQAVRVSRDVTFEVKTIKAGNSLQLGAHQTIARYCTLASGKLHVKIDEQEPFTIGPNGLFKVVPGFAARIQNRLYIDSVLHISTFADG